MEAHGSLGSSVAEAIQKGANLLPDAPARPVIKNLGVDRLGALHLAISTVRRGGTISSPSPASTAASSTPCRCWSCSTSR